MEIDLKVYIKKIKNIMENKNRFKGIFKNDKEYEGEGDIIYENGDKYKGEIKEGKKEGKGIIIKNNEDRFEGIFKNDKEYTGIEYINNNDKIYEKRIEKGNIKENELIIDINENNINKEIQILNYENKYDNEEKNKIRKEEREKNIDIKINDINIKYRYKN